MRTSILPDRNFVGVKYRPETDRGMFYDEEVIEALEPGDRSLGHLLVRLGRYKSVAEAFRDGWNKPLPVGWHQFDVGKGDDRLGVTIWNPTKTMEEYGSG